MDRRTSPTEVSRMCAKMTQPSLALVRPVNCARTIYMKNATLPKTTPWWSNGTAISAERRGGIRAKTRSHDEICPDVDRTMMSAEKPAAFPFFSHRRCRAAGTSPGETFHRDADTRPVSTHGRALPREGAIPAPVTTADRNSPSRVRRGPVQKVGRSRVICYLSWSA